MFLSLQYLEFLTAGLGSCLKPLFFFFFFFASEDVLKFSFEIEGSRQCLVLSLLSAGEFQRHVELQGWPGGRLVLGAESGTGAVGCGLHDLASLPLAGLGCEKAPISGPGFTDLRASPLPLVCHPR